MELKHWEPFSELVSLRQAMDRLLEDSFVRPPRLISGILGEGPVPPIDMYQEVDKVVVRVSLPGVKAEDMDITISGDTLTIKGESKSESEVKKESYLYQEHRYGGFSRSVSLPVGLEADKTEATFKGGVLTLTIPRVEELKPKEIKVIAKESTEENEEKKA